MNKEVYCSFTVTDAHDDAIANFRSTSESIFRTHESLKQMHDLEERDNSSERWEISFTTTNGAPTDAIAAIAEQHPNMTFVLLYWGLKARVFGVCVFREGTCFDEIRIEEEEYDTLIDYLKSDKRKNGLDERVNRFEDLIKSELTDFGWAVHFHLERMEQRRRHLTRPWDDEFCRISGLGVSRSTYVH